MIYIKYNSENYNKIFDIYIKNKKNFVLKKTNYTAHFQQNNSKKIILLNQTGQPDPELLSLINKTRKDAKIYLKKNYQNTKPTELADVTWYYYNDFAGKNNQKGEIIKLDIDAAYWSIAQKIGLLSEKTNEYFEYITKDKNKKEKKQNRLKALGSLATTKIIYTYENSKLISTKTDIQHTKHIYIYICKKTADLMLKIALQNDLLYYYWDCLFINTKAQLERVKFYLQKENLKFKIDYDFYEIIKGNYISYIKMSGKKYNYPISKKDIIFKN